MNQPPPYGHHGPPRVHVDPRELRPGRGWYVVGALVLVIGFVTAFVGFLVSVFSTVGIAEFEARVTSGQDTAFTVEEPGFELGLYASSGGSSDSCSLVLPDGSASDFGQPGYSHNSERGSESWSLVGTQQITESGEYTLSCSYVSETTEFAVANNGDGGVEIVRGVGAAFLWAIVPSLLGLAIGLPILITTAVRRNRLQRRLLAERHRQQYGHQ